MLSSQPWTASSQTWTASSQTWTASRRRSWRCRGVQQVMVAVLGNADLLELVLATLDGFELRLNCVSKAWRDAAKRSLFVARVRGR